MPATPNNVVNAREEARKNLLKALQPGSPIGIAFVGIDADVDGNIPVLFVNASSDMPEIITYDFGSLGLFGEVAALVAKDANIDIDNLKEHDISVLAARSVAAAACSSTRVPGVAAKSISTRPVMEACKDFATEHRVGSIEAVSLARSRKLAWKIGKIVKPRKREKSSSSDDNASETLLDSEASLLF